MLCSFRVRSKVTPRVGISNISESSVTAGLGQQNRTEGKAFDLPTQNPLQYGQELLGMGL